MAPRIYATTHEHTARTVLVVVGACTSIEFNKNKEYAYLKEMSSIAATAGGRITTEFTGSAVPGSALSDAYLCADCYGRTGEEAHNIRVVEVVLEEGGVRALPRNRMKRVEKQGTFETQQQMTVMHQRQQQQPSRAGRSQLPLSPGSDTSIHRTDTALTHHGGGGVPRSHASADFKEGAVATPIAGAHAGSTSSAALTHASILHVRFVKSHTQGGASPNRNPPPSIAVLEEDEWEDKAIEHERK
ncbi:uncharacterized protein LACBIDRAFT_331744 [Laccaria bicolor S238N-H82]|uniref:Predicted protein n=1 Tax=Laccaria bicolor (strain S238N-H82 / ATCC MYA-4686) TaxID=486041 RepID=B0DQF0_LACBS|nr:uncharacterized protein LACBIDRAFT_331744 [Laccaria bicolor S238N-H82]EDR03100.1 predicted protein [Laccaria bicolor S238N-H82]|eukprot:XP_001886241.1 predicted protein [Laccaria bicolor S238N-H82]